MLRLAVLCLIVLSRVLGASVLRGKIEFWFCGS